MDREISTMETERLKRINEISETCWDLIKNGTEADKEIFEIITNIMTLQMNSD